MEWQISDVTNVVSAFFLLAAIIVSLFIGLKSIRNTRILQQDHFRRTEEFQQREHIEKLVAHVREWAMDVITANFGGEISIMAGISETVHKQQLAANRVLKCQGLLVRGKEEIQPIALSLSKEHFDENFSSDIMSVVNILGTIISKIRERGQDVDNPEINKQLQDFDEQLWILAGAVIKQTAEYTTRRLDSS